MSLDNIDQPGAVVDMLLIEDNPRDADLTLRALRKSNLANHVTWVKDGAEALDLIFGPSGDPSRVLAQTPRLIMLDLKMPKVDGHEVLRRLKADPRTRAIPVVVLTSSREERDVERSYDRGANSYIVKPVDFANFSEAIQQVGLYWLVLNQPPEFRVAPKP